MNPHSPLLWLAEWGHYMVANETCRQENERPLNMHSQQTPRRFSIAELHIIYDGSFVLGNSARFGVSARGVA